MNLEGRNLLSTFQKIFSTPKDKTTDAASMHPMATAHHLRENKHWITELLLHGTAQTDWICMPPLAGRAIPQPTNHSHRRITHHSLGAVKLKQPLLPGWSFLLFTAAGTITVISCHGLAWTKTISWSARDSNRGNPLASEPTGQMLPHYMQQVQVHWYLCQRNNWCWPFGAIILWPNPRTDKPLIHLRSRAHKSRPKTGEWRKWKKDNGENSVGYAACSATATQAQLPGRLDVAIHGHTSLHLREKMFPPAALHTRNKCVLLHLTHSTWLLGIYKQEICQVSQKWSSLQPGQQKWMSGLSPPGLTPAALTLKGHIVWNEVTLWRLYELH